MGEKKNEFFPLHSHALFSSYLCAMKKHVFIQCLMVGLLLPCFASGQYSIEGIVTDSLGAWGSIHLEYVPSLEKLNSANARNQLNSAVLDDSGHFKLEGTGLPKGKHLYRLFLMKKTAKNGEIGISYGINRNFNLLVLDADTKLSLECPDIAATFGPCRFEASPETEAISYLYDAILLNTMKEYEAAGEHISALRQQFLSKQLATELKHFADTTKLVLPGLVALQMLPDLAAEFKDDPRFFERFTKKAMTDDPDSPYAYEFEAKISALKVANFGESTDWTKPLLVFFMALSFLFAGTTVHLYRMLSRLRLQIAPVALPKEEAIKSLSTKELEVLRLMAAGKSNKEIAANLFIEPATVKSHINRIYQKLGISARREAQEIVKILESE
jgi:DNA-binding CsgD family transcriptional regulator